MIYSKFSGNLNIKIYGSSHDEAMYVDIFGLPKGYKIDMKNVSLWLNERKASLTNSLSTKRIEADIPLTYNVPLDEYSYEEFITTDSFMSFMIKNTNINSSDYNLRFPRPSHCDIVAHYKYKNVMNLNGSGMFSGRMSAMLVIVGAISYEILKQLLPNITIDAKLISIGDIKEEHIDLNNPENIENINIEKHKDYFDKIIKNGDSLGGKILSYVHGLPLGLGGAIFDSIDAQISYLLFCISGVKAVEFGNGVMASSIKGSENNDAILSMKDNMIKTASNNSGGIVAGMTNTMPLVVTTHFKPTPSISKKQKTIDLLTNKPHTLKIKGRHDVAYVTRCKSAVKSAVAISILDNLLAFEAYKNATFNDKLEAYRYNIDEIDKKIVNLLTERMCISKKIGQYKKKNNIEILDVSREKDVLNNIPENLRNIFKEIMKQSKENQ